MAICSSLRPPALAAFLWGATVLAGTGGDARADDTNPPNVGSTGKGIVGGALLGGEVVTIVESLAGVRAGWAYWVGAIVGAGGGGVGGWAIEQGSSDGVVPMAMLAGGLGLLIPAVVLSLDATRFRPEEGATEDHVPTGPTADPGAAGGSVVGPAPASAPPAATPAAPPPQSLLDLRIRTDRRADTTDRRADTGADVRVGVPVPNVRPVFSLAEQRQYGMHAETEVRMPVLHVTF